MVISRTARLPRRLTLGAREFDDHILLAFIPPDSIGSDGEKRIPVDTSTPERWYVPDISGE